MEKFFYRVSSGETIFSVAQKLEIPTVVLIKQNNLKSELAAGDLLYIEKDSCSLYKVEPFDTLDSVSKKFCVSEQTLKEINGVDYLFYGLIIKVGSESNPD